MELSTQLIVIPAEFNALALKVIGASGAIGALEVNETLSKEYGVVVLPTLPSHLKPIQTLLVTLEVSLPNPLKVNVLDVAVA